MNRPADSTQARLDRIRGPVPPRSHNARTIAALAANPGCARRAILDAAGADKQRIAAHLGFPPRYGQSQFAITRGNAFEAQVKADGCAELLTLLRAHLSLPIPEASYNNLDEVGGDVSQHLRHTRTQHLLGRAARSGEDAGTLFDHPLLRLEVGGRPVYLEPDLIAFQLHGRFHVVEIKSFAVIDGQADGDKVAAAVIQSAVYVLALRDLLAGQGIGPEAVADEVLLVCPENFSSKPAAASLDVRRQLTVLRRQLSRLERIDSLLRSVPAELSFDLLPDQAGTARRDPADLAAAMRVVPARYAPDCLSTCEMCFFCRDEAAALTARLGRTVLEDLGGIEHLGMVLRLASGQARPGDDQAEAALLLAGAARMRGELLGEAV
ncbi:MAG TPA: hypothetical protein VF834_14445 [Streptosporangiaceae bacterium]